MKRRIRLKKYASHILPIPAVTSDMFEYPIDKNALISCVTRTTPFLVGETDLSKLILPFNDVEDANVPGAFNSAYAREIIRFIKSIPDSVTDLYVCCSKGGSRSPALAAALLKASGRSDRTVWKNPYYVPNKLVYKIMRDELGYYIPWIIVKLKSFDNEMQFKKAKRKGDSGKYERWQILH
jgi:predicted protein tyrosine phosphatase